MTSPNESLGSKNLEKNTGVPNELASFEQLDLEHPENTKPMFAPTTANHPGDGTTLRTTAPRVMYMGGRRRQPEAPGGAGKICLTPQQLQF